MDIYFPKQARLKQFADREKFPFVALKIGELSCIDYGLRNDNQPNNNLDFRINGAVQIRSGPSHQLGRPRTTTPNWRQWDPSYQIGTLHPNVVLLYFTIRSQQPETVTTLSLPPFLLPLHPATKNRGYPALTNRGGGITGHRKLFYSRSSSPSRCS